MSLQYAILIALTEGPRSGYDIAKLFDQSVGFFWRARHSQIYRELGKLKDKAWAEAKEIVQSDKPNRIEFRITDAGREALMQWSRQPIEPQELKDDFLVQLYGIEAIDLDALRANLLARQERHRDLHAQYEAKYKLLENSDILGDIGRRLALEVALIYEREWGDWCARALDQRSPEALGAQDNVISIEQEKRA